MYTVVEGDSLLHLVNLECEPHKGTSDASDSTGGGDGQVATYDKSTDNIGG